MKDKRYKKRPQDKELIHKILEEDKAKDVEDDEKLEQNAQMAYFLNRHEKEMNKHSQDYGEILHSYSDNVSYTLKMKRIFKIVFFIFAILALVFTPVLFAIISCKVFYYISKGYNNLSIIATLLSSLISIVTVYNVIPEIIAKYLFNIKEDENMTKFIGSMQTYDSELIKYMNNQKIREMRVHEIKNKQKEDNKKELS